MGGLQIFFSLIALAIIAGGGYMLYTVPVSYRRSKRLENEGKPTIATITKGGWTRSGQQKIYRTEYEYVVNNETVTGSRDLNLQQRFRDGKVQIVYLEDNPKIHRIPDVDMSPLSGVIVMAVFGLGLMGFGVYLIFAFVL